MVVFWLVLILTGYLFMAIPKGFLPDQDTGQIFLLLKVPRTSHLKTWCDTKKEVAAMVGKIGV